LVIYIIYFIDWFFIVVVLVIQVHDSLLLLIIVLKFFCMMKGKIGKIGVVTCMVGFIFSHNPILNFNLNDLFLPKCYLLLWDFIWLLAGRVKKCFFFLVIIICPISLLLMVNNLIGC
jgi:hypothetical protein